MGVFVHVAEGGSFAAAGRALRMSPPAVTRAIAGLERVVGARLLTRTTRRVALTEAGRRYLEDCRRILSDVADAESTAAGSSARPTGTLRVTAPVAFGQRHVLPVLGDFLHDHPAVTGRALFLDRVVDLIDEGVDVALRIGHLPDSSLRSIRVGHVRRVLVGSPAYLQASGTPQDVAQLREHSIIAVTSSPSPTVRWTFGPGDREAITLRPLLSCNTIQGALQAATAGWGLTRLLSYQVHDEVASGRLQRVLADALPDPLPVHLVHPEGRHTSAKVRAFLDFASARLRKRLAELSETFD